MLKNNPTTKERLLQAASKIFAEKGFRDATVAEICETAEANIASVNYHFGDKESLYDEVWRHAFSITVKAYPVDGSLSEHPELKDYLHSFSSAILHRIFAEDATGLFAKLLYREMASPTLALDRITTEALWPQIEFLEKTVGGQVDKQQLRLCMNSIIGQCAFYNFSRPLREHVIGKKTMTEAEIEQIARHIALFSLGGLKEIQK